MIEHTLWIAEAGNGTIQFDTQPSHSDILNACEDLDGEIEVYVVTTREIARDLCFKVSRGNILPPNLQ